MRDDAKRPEAVIFDYGGVLNLPTSPEAFQANLKALAVEHGFRRGKQLWHHIYRSDAWERAKRGQITEDEWWADRLAALGIHDEAAVAAFRERLFWNAPSIHPDMQQLCHDLRPVTRLAVLSNTAVRDMDRWLAEKHGMDGVFEVVVSSADVGLAKPEAAIYHLTLERLDLPPDAVLFVDDLRRNTWAARALGIASIRFTTPQALRDELAARGLL